MKTIKLSEWCEKTGVKYLTAWRWFKNDQMPVHAYQTETGTILVQDEDDQEPSTNTASNDAMSIFLKKTVEFSKNSSTVEDFAAYILSNFQLKLNATEKMDSPKYSRNRPKQEEVQKHFQRFIPDKKDQERLKVVKTLLSEGQAAGDVVPAELSPLGPDSIGEPDEDDVITQLSKMASDELAAPYFNLSVNTNSPIPPVGGCATPNVDCLTTTIVTPQPINYTGSTSSTTSNQGGSSLNLQGDISNLFYAPSESPNALHSSAPKEMIFNNNPQAINSVLNSSLNFTAPAEIAETERPRKRGRKPSKKR